VPYGGRPLCFVTSSVFLLLQFFSNFWIVVSGASDLEVHVLRLLAAFNLDSCDARLPVTTSSTAPYMYAYIVDVNVVSRWILTVPNGSSSFNHLYRQQSGNSVTDRFPVTRACFFCKDYYCLRLIPSIPTIFRHDGSKPESVFRERSWCGGRGLPMSIAYSRFKLFDTRRPEYYFRSAAVTLENAWNQLAILWTVRIQEKATFHTPATARKKTLLAMNYHVCHSGNGWHWLGQPQTVIVSREKHFGGSQTVHSFSTGGNWTNVTRFYRVTSETCQRVFLDRLNCLRWPNQFQPLPPWLQQTGSSVPEWFPMWRTRFSPWIATIWDWPSWVWCFHDGYSKP